ncbi:unnamed protein product [Menidia menidia]|uniref:(Atlantic silverside) hypothetical protein n=1 Tax=Menidia menidia TaxID=238744 RepID=A0A8S4BGY5_9TELE|nr:unnamed protein product [Menidia menidia]
MASCLVPDFPAVMMALEHLRELDKHLSEEGVPFAPEASLHLAELTANVSGLEAERRAAREHLEVATIENSKLRHRFNDTRARVTEEIMADVAAVRASNAEEIERLRGDIGAACRLQEETEERVEALLVHNQTLRPEREKLKAEEDAAVATLNDQLNLKYSLQMQLEETQALIEELRSSMAAVQQEKVNLKETMAREREAFAEKKENLSRELVQTTKDALRQQVAVARRREELEAADRNKEDASTLLGELDFHRARMEASLKRLAAARRQCGQRLEAELQRQEELRREEEALQRERDRVAQAFLLAAGNLEQQMANMEAKTEEVRAAKPLILDALAQALSVFTQRQEEEGEARAEHRQVRRQLGRSKRRLEERVASIVKHGKEIKEMERQVQELRQADAINRRVSQRNQEEACGDLEAEKKSVCLLQEEKKRLCRLLEERRRTQEAHAADMSSRVSATRRRHQELLREEAALGRREPRGAGELELHLAHVPRLSPVARIFQDVNSGSLRPSRLSCLQAESRPSGEAAKRRYTSSAGAALKSPQTKMASGGRGRAARWRSRSQPCALRSHSQPARAFRCTDATARERPLSRQRSVVTTAT